MYLPPHFNEINIDEIKSIVEAYPLGCIVAHTEEGLIANHIPMLSAPDGTLIGHVAKSNDIHRLVSDEQEVLVIFRGDNAYVSPNYYPTKKEHHKHVPTWNYQVVHVYGGITFQHDDQSKRAAVGLLTRKHERQLNGDKGWRMADAPKDYMNSMIENIVALRIKPTKLIAKSKLSQNRDEIDYIGAVNGLRSAGHSILADKMNERLGKSV